MDRVVLSTISDTKCDGCDTFENVKCISLKQKTIKLCFTCIAGSSMASSIARCDIGNCHNYSPAPIRFLFNGEIRLCCHYCFDKHYALLTTLQEYYDKTQRVSAPAQEELPPPSPTPQPVPTSPQPLPTVDENTISQSDMTRAVDYAVSNLNDEELRAVRNVNFDSLSHQLENLFQQFRLRMDESNVDRIIAFSGNQEAQSQVTEIINGLVDRAVERSDDETNVVESNVEPVNEAPESESNHPEQDNNETQ